MVWAPASLQTTAEGKVWSEPAHSSWTRKLDDVALSQRLKSRTKSCARWPRIAVKDSVVKDWKGSVKHWETYCLRIKNLKYLVRYSVCRMYYSMSVWYWHQDFFLTSLNIGKMLCLVTMLLASMLDQQLPAKSCSWEWYQWVHTWPRPAKVALSLWQHRQEIELLPQANEGGFVLADTSTAEVECPWYGKMQWQQESRWRASQIQGRERARKGELRWEGVEEMRVAFPHLPTAEMTVAFIRLPPPVLQPCVGRS